MEIKKLIKIADVVDSLHQTPEYTDKGIPMVRVTDVKSGDLSLQDCLCVSEDVFDKFTAKHVPCEGDIVISRVGTYGNFSYVSSDEKFCLGQNTAIIIPHINSRYLYYYLLSPMMKAQIESRVVGSTQKTLSLKNIKDLDIPCFEKSKQDKIASILESIDKKIKNNNRINRNLQDQAKAIYKEMVIELSEGETTEGVLSDIAVITMGQSPKGDTYNEEGNGAVFYQGRAEFGDRFPTRRLFTTEPKRVASANDVLMSVRAPVGDINVAYEECCIGRGLGAVHSKDDHQSFVLYTMFALREAFDIYNGEGTVFGSINRDAMNKMSIRIPSILVMDKFEETVSPMDTLIRKNYEETCRLVILRDSLLPKLMSGELDVSELKL